MDTYQTSFLKCLEGANTKGHYRISQVFDDFLIFLSCALRQAVYQHKNKGIQDSFIEAQYMELVPKYGSAGMNKLCEAYARLIEGLEYNAHDFLGECYMDMDASNAKTGQFFTPSSLSEAIAQMTVSEEDYCRHLSEGKRIKFMDCAIGAGGMLIAIVPLLRQWKAHPSTVYFDGTDIDIRCVRMAYIQMTLLGMPATIRHGNSLSLEQWEQWETLALAMNPLSPGDCAVEVPLSSSQPENTPTNPPQEVRRKLTLGPKRI